MSFTMLRISEIRSCTYPYRHRPRKNESVKTDTFQNFSIHGDNGYMRTLILVLVLFVAGCTTPRFTRDEPFTMQEFNKDAHECQDRASAYIYIHQAGITTRCMTDKGWTRTN